MNYTRLAQWFALTALGITVLGGIGLVRYYQTTPELRLPEYEAYWHLVPLLALALLAAALLLSLGQRHTHP